MIATFESSVLRVYLLCLLPKFACYTRLLENSVATPNAFLNFSRFLVTTKGVHNKASSRNGSKVIFKLLLRAFLSDLQAFATVPHNLFHSQQPFLTMT